MTTTKVLHPYFTFERGTLWKKIEFYLDFENLKFNFKPIKAILNMFMAIWPLQNYYSLFYFWTRKVLKNKLGFYLDFRNLGFINFFQTKRPPYGFFLTKILNESYCWIILNLYIHIKWGNHIISKKKSIWAHP